MGVFISLILIAAEGLFAFGLLAIFFVLGTLASSYQKAVKKKRNLPGSKESKRSWQNAAANAGPAAIFAFLSIISPGSAEEYLVMMAASLAAATADTLSSELGMVTGKRFFDTLTWHKAKAGDDGAISIMGLFFGLVGSCIVALCCVPLFPVYIVIAIIAFCGFMGTVFDSILGSGPELQGLMNNHTVNFTSCLAAGTLAGFFMRFIGPLVF